MSVIVPVSGPDAVVSARSSKLVTMPVRNVRARRMPPAERREALINATLPLVLWHGPGVTTRQIAEAADVAEGTIFRVFEGKEALIRAVTERAFDPAPALAEIADDRPRTAAARTGSSAWSRSCRAASTPCSRSSTRSA